MSGCGQARAYLRDADPVLARLIEDRPDFDPRAWLAQLPPMDLFGALLFQVTGQQLSVAATRRTLARIRDLFGGRLPAPAELLAADPAALRAAGLSWRKVATLRDLAGRLADGRLDQDALAALPDDEVIAELTTIPGIGPWTAQGALLLALGREDVVLPGDLALRKAIRAAYQLDHLPAQQKSSPSPPPGGPTAAWPPATCSPPPPNKPAHHPPPHTRPNAPPEISGLSGAERRLAVQHPIGPTYLNATQPGGFAGAMRGPRILAACLSTFITSSLTAHDLPGLARFWTQALGWKILSQQEREIVIGTDENAPVGMCFMPVTDPKTVKNRVHLDLTTSAQDRDQEIERLLALGARRVDIGQTGAESWTVLADPEGNEFCVIRPKETLTR